MYIARVGGLPFGQNAVSRSAETWLLPLIEAITKLRSLKVLTQKDTSNEFNWDWDFFEHTSTDITTAHQNKPFGDLTYIHAMNQWQTQNGPRLNDAASRTNRI
jgi:hypothetical protein